MTEPVPAPAPKRFRYRLKRAARRVGKAIDWVRHLFLPF
jgi:hypothetical protein